MIMLDINGGDIQGDGSISLLNQIIFSIITVIWHLTPISSQYVIEKIGYNIHRRLEDTSGSRYYWWGLNKAQALCGNIKIILIILR